MQLLEEATNLFKNLEDLSHQGRINDRFALELFPYHEFISMIKKGRYEAAFYCLPLCA